MIGSFKCKCKPGFKIVAGQCRDIDECISGQHDCAAVATGIFPKILIQMKLKRNALIT